MRVTVYCMSDENPEEHKETFTSEDDCRGKILKGMYSLMNEEGMKSLMCGDTVMVRITGDWKP